MNRAKTKLSDSERIISLLAEGNSLKRKILEEIQKMSTTVGAGLSALEATETQEVVDLAALQTAVNAAVADLQSTIANAGEDATVGSIAATMNTQLTAIQTATAALNTAVAAQTPAPTVASTTDAPAAGATS
jgi:hypothetical protein